MPELHSADCPTFCDELTFQRVRLASGGAGIVKTNTSPWVGVTRNVFVLGYVHERSGLYTHMLFESVTQERMGLSSSLLIAT